MDYSFKEKLMYILEQINQWEQRNSLEVSIENRLNASLSIYKENLEYIFNKLISTDAINALKYIAKIKTTRPRNKN